MTLEDAIQIMKTDLLVPGSIDKLHFQDAEQISIEALEFRKSEKEAGHLDADDLLPSETPF